MKQIRGLAQHNSKPKSVNSGSRRTAKCKVWVELPDAVRSPIRAEFLIGLQNPKRRTTARKPVKVLGADRLAASLAALGHPVRLRVLALLLRGSASYEELTRATGMRSGPLYFHLQQLRTAGLIGPRRRDEYALTQRGRVLALVAMTIGRLGR